VEADLLRAALCDVAERHQALRSRYVMADQPVAVIQPPPTAPAFTMLPDVADETAAEQALLGELIEPLDLEGGEVWRSALVRVRGSERSLFGLVVHHVAMDGWAADVLSADLSAAYALRTRGQAARFAGPAPTMASVSADYRRQAAASDLAAQREYWRRTLTGVPPLRFPGQREPAGPGGHRPRRLAVRERAVPADALARVDRRAADRGTTRTVVALAAYAQALRSVTGQRDFGIGLPIGRRDSALLNSAVTCLTNTICLRISTAAEEETDLITAVHNTMVAGLAAQDVPFHEVVGLVGRSTGDRQPLYQTVFAVQDNAVPELRLPGCTAEFHRIDTTDLDCELLTELWVEGPAAATLRLSFRPAQLSGATAESIFATLFDLLVEGPKSVGAS
jgi:hypothetical protein